MKHRIKKIICATDFSQNREILTGYGRWLAGKLDARLYILHVVCSITNPIYGTVDKRQSREHIRLINKAVSEIKKRMAGTDNWEPVVTVGEPVEEIQKAAKYLNADIVIAASHRFKGLKRIFYGTVIEKLARNLDIPVIVIKRQGKDKNKTPVFNITKIVAGCHMDGQYRKIPSYAAYFAKEFQAELYLAHAKINPVDEELTDSFYGPYSKIEKKLDEKLRMKLENLVSNRIRGLKKTNIVILHGPPGEQLCKYALEKNADLLVVGARPRTGFGRIIIGSATESLIRNAECPVLVVPCNKKVSP